MYAWVFKGIIRKDKSLSNQEYVRIVLKNSVPTYKGGA